MSDISYDDAKSAARSTDMSPVGRKFIAWVIEEICCYGQPVYDTDHARMVENAVRHDVAQEILHLLKPEGE